MGNTCFEHKSLHKYTRVARGHDGVEVKSMIIVLVKKDMLHFVQDVRAVRGMGQGISDHHIVMCKVRLVGMWIKRRKVVGGIRKIRSEKLREHNTEKDMLSLLRGRK